MLLHTETEEPTDSAFRWYSLSLTVVLITGLVVACRLRPAPTSLTAMRPPTPTGTLAVALSDEGVTLTGYRPISAESLVPGYPTLLTLAWQRAGTDAQERYVAVQLVGPGGNVIDTSAGALIAFDSDASRATTTHQLTLPADAAENAYTLVAGLSDRTGADVQTATIGTLPVVRPESVPVVAGPLGDFPPGSVTPLRLDAEFVDWDPPVDLEGSREGNIQATAERVSPIPLFLVRDEDAGAPFGLALYQRDPHLGCLINWQASEELFINPCHGETYDRHGQYVKGPAPRGLDRFAVEVRDGEVVVGIGYLIPGPPKEKEEDTTIAPLPTEAPAAAA